MGMDIRSLLPPAHLPRDQQKEIFRQNLVRYYGLPADTPWEEVKALVELQVRVTGAMAVLVPVAAVAALVMLWWGLKP